MAKNKDLPTCWDNCNHCDKKLLAEKKKHYRMCTLHDIKTYDSSYICTSSTYVRPHVVHQEVYQPQKSDKGWDDF